MNSLPQLLLGLCLVLYFQMVFTWKNEWDRPLNFQCPLQTQAIDAVVSYHRDDYEDRRYELHCGNVIRSSDVAVNCEWTGYVNDFDQVVHFQCPGAGYINGMASYHRDSYEDRRHKFRCCGPKSSNYYYRNCRWTGWLNNFDDPVAYFVPDGFVLRGVNSVHNDNYEDRRFQFEVCQLLTRK
ncbi:hemagglutinin/amebocyte aggregation factor-like [Saccostrea cucullata]|uniref:hemagglutinin/amebocyte aggregation factor-like n=1 Tax=Saccostrea cuccullata TaxID=36930 RepID=UPI002ED3A8A6